MANALLEGSFGIVKNRPPITSKAIVRFTQSDSGGYDVEVLPDVSNRWRTGHAPTMAEAIELAHRLVDGKSE